MKKSIGSIFLAFVFLTILASACAPAPTPVLSTSIPLPTDTPVNQTAALPTALQPFDSERKLTVNGLERTYLLHIPPTLDRLHPAPVVFAFHGLDEEPSAMASLTGFNDIADQANFLVVYPAGVELSWNVGECCGFAATNNVDEISFVRQILSDLGTVASVDPKRIYATGLSNGAPLVYQLACEMSDIFASIAPVAGVLVYSPCQPQQPVSLIQVHGLADTTVPYAGGGGLDTPPVEQVINTWAQLDGCAGSPHVDNPIKTIKHTVYAPCQAGTAVELYAIESGGHGWVAKSVWPASQVIWDFFAAHPKP